MAEPRPLPTPEQLARDIREAVSCTAQADTIRADRIAVAEAVREACAEVIEGMSAGLRLSGPTRIRALDLSTVIGKD